MHLQCHEKQTLTCFSFSAISGSVLHLQWEVEGQVWYCEWQVSQVLLLCFT